MTSLVSIYSKSRDPSVMKRSTLGMSFPHETNKVADSKRRNNCFIAFLLDVMFYCQYRHDSKYPTYNTVELQLQAGNKIRFFSRIIIPN